MCSIVTADMERRQDECRQWKIRCALNESKEGEIKRFDRWWRSGMRVSREGGMFWIHAIIQSTAFDETLRYCHCFDPVKLRDDQFAALKAAWEPELETRNSLNGLQYRLNFLKRLSKKEGVRLTVSNSVT